MGELRSVYEEHGGSIPGRGCGCHGGRLRRGLCCLEQSDRRQAGPAWDTAAQRLGELRSVYEESGGGIQGAAAAVVDGVKDVFDDIV